MHVEARVGAELSDEACAHHGRRVAGRRHRHHRAPPRTEVRRRLRAAVRGRESARCVEHHRRRHRGQGAVRRLHTAAGHQHRAVDRTAHHEARVRPDQGSDTGVVDRGGAERRAGGRICSGERHQGTHRSHQGEPGAFAYGSSGTGSTQHLAGEAFALSTGTKMVHVPYKGRRRRWSISSAGRYSSISIRRRPAWA